MNKITFIFLFSVVFSFFAPTDLSARDFGLLANQSVGLGGIGFDDTDGITYEVALVPRFSALLGRYGELFLSASAQAVLEDDEWSFTPELLRTEFSHLAGAVEFRVGRMLFADPLNLVASGLFDGLHFARNTAGGTFGAGLWYTGFLYKNRANITMTEDDAVALEAAVDWDDFMNTYFASRRVMAALYWEHPSVAELFQLNVTLIGQADINERDRQYDSLYLIARGVLPLQRVIFELGGAVEAGRMVVGAETDFRVAFAGDVGLHWLVPAQIHSMVSLTGRFTSGQAESGVVSAFTPITTLPHGDILEAGISGLSVLTLQYTARLHRTFSAGVSAAHFVRSDRGTFEAYPLAAQSGDNFFLGTEFFGRLLWSPVSDMSFNLGGGVFLPSLGNAVPDADPRWRVELAVTLALF